MNLCVSHGHSQAFLYPIGIAMDESNFIRERESTRIITEAELVRQAVAGLLIKESRKQFSKLVKQLNVEAVPMSDEPTLTEEQRRGPTKSKTLRGVKLPGDDPKGPLTASKG